ncbi:MAG: hypothetical protein R3D44_08850 [Hyphomicrobiaceae bacterium]
MRWLKGILVVLLVSYAGVCTLVLASREDRRIALPSYQFDHDAKSGSFEMTGTWKLDEAELGYPIQSTTIRCIRSNNVCIEATAVIPEGSLLMPVSLEFLSIDKWDSDSLIFRGRDGQCFDMVYSAAFATKSVTGLAQLRRDRSEVCGAAIETNRKKARRGHFGGARKAP